MAHDAGQRPITARTTSGEDGFVIVAVLWILTALATLAMVYSIFVSNTALALTGATDRVQTDAAFRAAIEMTCHRILNGDAGPGVGRIALRVGSVDITATYVSEAARIDLNFASRDLLAGLMTGFGEDPAKAASYAARIVAWRTKVTGTEMDEEANLYRTVGLTYLPRRAPFPHVDELWMVYGIPAFVIARMLPHVTVYSGRAGINLAEASEQVIAALPGMSSDKLQAVLARRMAGPAPPGELIGLAGVGGDTATPEKARAMRIAVQMVLKDGHRVTSEAVILLRDEAGEPYRVLTVRADIGDEPGAWQERVR